METAVTLLKSLGCFVSVAGLVVECVAMLAMDSYRLRSRLPVASPVELLGRGCAAFFGGVLIVALAQALAATL